ncbi:hypothetical protein ACWEWX_51630, partial [Streptomyces asiaticus]
RAAVGEDTPLPFVTDACRTAPAPAPMGRGRTAACHRAPEWRELIAGPVTAQGPSGTGLPATAP